MRTALKPIQSSEKLEEKINNLLIIKARIIDGRFSFILVRRFNISFYFL